MPALATDSQRAYLRTLLDERDYSADFRIELTRDAQRGLTKARASAAIEWLKAQPRRADVFSPATRGQVNYLRSVLESRDVPADRVAELVGKLDAGTLSFDEASAALDEITKLGDRLSPAAGAPQVANGRYALGTKDNPRRYQVKAGRTRTFVNLIEAHDHRTDVPAAQALAVLAEIAADPMRAAKLYAEVTNRCFRCNLLLTDPDSVARGMGKKCETYLGVADAPPAGVEGEIEVGDTVKVRGERGRWTVESFHTGGTKAGDAEVSRAVGNARRGGLRITVTNFPMFMLTLVRKGNAEQDAIDELDRLHPVKVDEPTDEPTAPVEAGSGALAMF